MRRGYSLVELLVVIAVIGVLTALALPAVQRARAAAVTVQCRNNLRQIGAALHHCAAVTGRFPPGGVEWRPAHDATKRQLAWSAFLLPYLEQEALFRRIDFALPFDHAANAPAAASVVTTYLCPASRRTSPRIDGRGACDYGGLFGERITGPNQPPKGAMVYDRAFRPEDIVDGLSWTIFVGEDSHWPDGQWVNGRNLFDQAFAVNQAPAFENDLRSDHVGGAHAAFGDGSVSLVREVMALRALAAICTRAGGEVE